MLASCIDGGAQEVEVADAGNLDRVLEREEDTFAGAFLRRQLKQILTQIGDRAGSDFEGIPARNHLGQGALAGAVRSHDGVDFT